MSKQTEALKLALEALEYISSHYMSLPKIGCMALAAVEEALAEQQAKEKAPQSANCEASGLISSDHARGNDCTTEQPYPDNFIDALKYYVAKRDSEAQQAYKDAFVNGTGVMLGDKRIDTASIYKQPEQEPVAYQCKGIPRKGCNYLAACDRVCNKCGEIHHHHQMVANFAAPPAQRKPLTDEQIEEIAARTLFPVNFARAIEATHGIKENT